MCYNEGENNNKGYFMLVIIERTLNYKFVVSKVVPYHINVPTIKNQSGGFNIFGNNLPDITYIINNQTLKYKSGEALTSELSEDDCKDFIINNELTLLKFKVHESIVTTLDSRYFR